jgi:hypothetical protein
MREGIDSLAVMAENISKIINRRVDVDDHE